MEQNYITWHKSAKKSIAAKKLRRSFQSVAQPKPPRSQLSPEDFSMGYEAVGTWKQFIHWGPILALTVIFTISWVTIRCHIMWWPPYLSLGGFCNIMVFLLWVTLTLYNYFAACVKGPGVVPLSWKPVCIFSICKSACLFINSLTYISHTTAYVFLKCSFFIGCFFLHFAKEYTCMRAAVL